MTEEITDEIIPGHKYLTIMFFFILPITIIIITLSTLVFFNILQDSTATIMFFPVTIWTLFVIIAILSYKRKKRIDRIVDKEIKKINELIKEKR